MKRKRTYQAERVERLDIDVLLPLLAAGCIVALDVAKEKFVVALATIAGEVVKLFRFNHPTETRRFMSVVEALRSGIEPGKLKAAMEPTGTYGDAVRHQLVRAGVPVLMVSPKRTHDSQELFDNVRSLHDPKSAVLIAKHCAMNLATEWQPPPTTQARLRALVDLRRHEQGREEVCFGRLEAVLARHWPEYGQWMDVRKQKTALRLLAHAPSPTGVAAAPEETKAFVREASRGRLAPALVEGLIGDAARTTGVEMVPEEEQLVRTLALEALAARQRGEELEDEMRKLTAEDEVFARLSRWMGVHTAAVVVTLCDPRQYANARQLEKACVVWTQPAREEQRRASRQALDHEAGTGSCASDALHVCPPNDRELWHRSRVVHAETRLHRRVQAARRDRRDAQARTRTFPCCEGIRVRSSQAVRCSSPRHQGGPEA